MRIGDMGNLRVRLTDAKLAGTKLPMSDFFGGGATYVFRSNEQAAERAVDIVAAWLAAREPRKLKIDWDESALVEVLADILAEAEAEWRKEPDTRDEYGNRWQHAAERALEELRRWEDR